MNGRIFYDLLPNHLLIAKITCLRFSKLSFSKELKNIFEVELKKYRVIVEKLLLLLLSLLLFGGSHLCVVKNSTILSISVFLV